MLIRPPRLRRPLAAAGPLLPASPSLALAQYWNLLAGYAGLVSVGQQAFVGLGGYALFAAIIYGGVDPLAAILLAGMVAGLLAIPTAFITFRLKGAYFAIGTWVVAEVFRLILAQVKPLGGGTGTSLPVEASRDHARRRFRRVALRRPRRRGARHHRLLAGAGARRR